LTESSVNVSGSWSPSDTGKEIGTVPSALGTPTVGVPVAVGFSFCGVTGTVIVDVVVRPRLSVAVTVMVAVSGPV
jgi:hypothetical protein